MLYLEMEKLKRKILAHRFAIIACLVVAGCVLWFASGKVAYIMVDNTEPPVRTFTPGIKILLTVTIPDLIYDMSQPYPAQIMCADGEKFLVLGGFSATKMDGGCE